MKSGLLTIGLALAVLPVFGQEQPKHYNKSVFSGFHRMQPVARNANLTRQKVQQVFPGMYITLDKMHGGFTDIFGTALAVPGGTPESKARHLFANQLASLGVVSGQWRKTASVSADHASYVNYEQVIQGHKVVFANLSFRFTPGGDLERIRMKQYGMPDLSLAPALSPEAATQAALQDVSGVTVSESGVEPDWYWFPVPGANGYELRPAYAFFIRGMGEELPVDLTGFVDAGNGSILYRTNQVKETVNQTVQGSVFKQNPLLPASVEPLANLKMTINGTDYYTDTAGLLDIPTLNAPVIATVKLEGKWAKVNAIASGGVTPSYQDTISTNGTTYTFPTTLPSSDRHVNAYYHVNRVHDFMKGFFPTFLAMDNPLPTNVDVSGTCNAFYNGTSINFFTAGGGCNSFANCGDIIYHEYGHGISDKFYGFMGQGSMNNGALNEGNSDIWGIGITNDPVLGKGSSTNGFIRRYDLAPKVYPKDIVGEVHADGEIIAGAWWDVAQNLGSTDTMSILFASTYFDTPDGPNGTEGSVYHEVLISALMNDDNDNNLSNGTPHFTQIVTAFAKHGIYLLGDATVTHSDIANQPSNTPVTISGTLSMSTPAFFQELRLYYRVRQPQGTAGAWDSLAMSTQGGTLYTAQIPGQAPGSVVEYYFGVVDNQAFLNATAPLGYHPSALASEVTIPYQFGVGLDTRTVVDFETPLTDWVVANAPGDNATGGKWIMDVPVGSFTNPVTQTVPVQPNFDHTSGSGQCLVTGNAASVSSQIGSADIDGGRTSVITDTFDLSGFTDPVIEYWRWYTNDKGSNPGLDYWNVYIRDVSSSFWIIRVDNTKASENRWRRRIFPLKQYLPASTHIQLKFQAEDFNPASLVEAAVDDIVIYDKGFPTSVSGPESLRAKIYPNPANRSVQVTLQQAAEATIRLSDLSGRVVYQGRTNGAADHVINTTAIPAGVYMITIQMPRFLQTQKVTIMH